MVESDKGIFSCRSYDPGTVKITRYPAAMCNKPVEIEPNEADIRIEVGPDGVFIGFFSNGKAALLSMDTLIQTLGPKSATAIKAWIHDRKNQAERLSLDNGA